MKKNLFDKLNKYLADTAVMYIKLHNLHWNVYGLQFKPVHEFLEALYDDTTEKMDEIAEVIRMKGEYPAASLEAYLKLTSIKELPSGKIANKEALAIVLKDLKALDAEAKDVRATADEADVFDVVMMMEDYCAFYQKTIWFISQMLA